jgi:hypothetical protein
MATNFLSTRVTFRHVDLARELALTKERANLSGRSALACPPAVNLAERCFRVSESLLQGGRNECAHDRESAGIAAVLRSATNDRPEGADRMGHALAVLHFVERTLGLGKKRHKASFVQGRVRSRNCGTYSTPDYIVDGMLQDLFSAFVAERRRSPLTILDMSLEGGHFALGSKQHAPRNRTVRFHGIDEDAGAVQLAKRILDFATQQTNSDRFSFQFASQDSLISALPRKWPEQFDAIVGNPPWTARKPWISDKIRCNFQPLLRGHYDLYLAFILRAHDLLRPGGYLSYVVPSGFLFNCTAAPVRRLLLENYEILALTTYSQRSFVEVPCIIPISFLARKRIAPGGAVGLTKITNADTGLGGLARQIGSTSIRIAHIWKKLPDCGMSPAVRSETAFLASDLPGSPLADFGRVSSGARLGKTNPVRPASTFRGIHACDLRPYHACLRRGRSFGKTEAVFDRQPDEAAIGAEKVVFQELRYMTHGQRLLAAVAGPGILPVSTAALFLPNDQEHSPFFAALLNSAIANAWYKFRDLNRAIKISYLRSLPVPKDLKVWTRVGLLARNCMDLRLFFHKRSDMCMIRNETLWWSTRFPREWKRLVEYQARIDTSLFDLYRVPIISRDAVIRLGTSRSF